MSTIAPIKSKKKFIGFTDLFKNVPKPKPVKKKENSKEPFTGFSDFYKKLKEHEIPDEDDYDSEYDAPFLSRVREKEKEKEKAPEPEEPPKPEDKHYKPQPYFTWCKQRTKEAFERCTEPVKPVKPVKPSAPNEDNASQKAESIQTNALLLQIKQRSCRKYENYRKYYDQSTLDCTSHLNGANPWFHKMLEKWINGEVKENQAQEVPPINEGLLDIFQTLNSRETLKLDERVPRNVNNYPSEMQLQLLNRRMKKFLKQTKAKNVGETGSQTSSIKTVEDWRNVDFNAGFASERKELADYFNKIVKPIQEIDFKPQDFKTWYAKMSFNYDRKYRYMPKFNISPEPEDFNEWLVKRDEEITRDHNQFSKAFYNVKSPRFESVKISCEKNERENFDHGSLADLSDKANQAVSNISSCRSRFVDFK